LVFGSMNLGTSGEYFMGGVDKESFKLLDYYYDQGGNFINVKLLPVVWIDGRRQTITGTKKARPGLVSECKSAGIGLRSFWPQNSQPHIKQTGRNTGFMSIMPATRASLCTFQ
jgi:hypothetical protein